MELENAADWAYHDPTNRFAQRIPRAEIQEKHADHQAVCSLEGQVNSQTRQHWQVDAPKEHPRAQENDGAKGRFNTEHRSAKEHGCPKGHRNA